MTHYHYHDVAITSEIDLGLPQDKAKLQARLHLHIERRANAIVMDGAPLWQSTLRDAHNNPHFSLYTVAGEPCLAVLGTGQFWLRSDRIVVYCQVTANPVPFLLGRILATWLELRGVPVLHGATVTMQNKATALVGESGAGKSTLATALLQCGYQLLADDLLPLFGSGMGHPLIAPGFPISRLWPDSAAHLLGDVDPLPRVHPRYNKRLWHNADYCDQHPRPLTRLVILARGAAEEVQLIPLTPAESLIQLQRAAHDPALAAALGLEKQRLQKLATIVATVPVYRLEYPNEFRDLDAVCARLAPAFSASTEP